MALAELTFASPPELSRKPPDNNLRNRKSSVVRLLGGFCSCRNTVVAGHGIRLRYVSQASNITRILSIRIDLDRRMEVMFTTIGHWVPSKAVEATRQHLMDNKTMNDKLEKLQWATGIIKGVANTVSEVRHLMGASNHV